MSHQCNHICCCKLFKTSKYCIAVRRRWLASGNWRERRPPSPHGGLVEVTLQSRTTIMGDQRPPSLNPTPPSSTSRPHRLSASPPLHFSSLYFKLKWTELKSGKLFSLPALHSCHPFLLARRGHFPAPPLTRLPETEPSCPARVLSYYKIRLYRDKI